MTVAAATPSKMNIIVFSGDMDKVLAAFILATTAASMRLRVNMFFTFWGLNVLRKKSLTAGLVPENGLRIPGCREERGRILRAPSKSLTLFALAIVII